MVILKLKDDFLLNGTVVSKTTVIQIVSACFIK